MTLPKLRRLLVTLLCALCIAALPAAAAPTAAWVARMDGLAAALTSLLADASAGPIDEEKRLRLRQDIAALRALAHGLNAMDATPDADPTIPVLLAELDAAVDDVARADDGRLSDAVFALAWTCMGCHTRAGLGSPRPIASLAPIAASLPPDVRGTAFAATRRFREARTVFRDAAYDEALAQREPVRWQRSVKGAILLDLRLNHDPKGALDIVDQVLSTPGGEALWEDAAAWRRVLVPMAKTSKPPTRTLAGLEAEAERLIADAQARGPTDAGAEILYLRATAVVHELLMRNPPKTMKAQALAWLGLSYRGLRDLDIWSLHLVYDAACVEAAPHSILAAECYQRWLDGARAAFSGNGGAGLPPDLAARESTLRALAAPP